MVRFRLPRAVRSAVICICLVSSAPACRHASAETVVEVWRSPFGNARSVSVNSADGSCWAATGRSVMHVASTGAILSQTDGFSYPIPSVSANSNDGSCWVAGGSQVVHLAADGTELWRGGAFAANSVAVNSSDGSCWVSAAGGLVHLAADGTELWRGSGLFARSVSVNPADGSVWVGEGHFEEPGQVVHLSADGDELWRGSALTSSPSVSVNPSDGSCWVGGGQLVHLAADGTELWRGGALAAGGVAASPVDGSVWVTMDGGYEVGDGSVVHVGADGRVIRSTEGFNVPYSLSVNATDGSVWVADKENAQVVHLGSEGDELCRVGRFVGPVSVSVNTGDGSCWVADAGRRLISSGGYAGSAVVHLLPSGQELWRGDSGFNGAWAVAANPNDGSCWVADRENNQVAHLSASGQVLTRRGNLYMPWCVSVDPDDGSCWVADAGDSQVVRFGEDGTELWRGSAFTVPTSVSVNPADGSCWVADTHGSQIVHLSANGEELRREWGFSGPESVSVNPTDGSCWVADNGARQVVHLGVNGNEIWRGGTFNYPISVSVNPTDGSCWVAAHNDNQVVHLSADGNELWRGGAFTLPSSVCVDPADGSCWVADTRDGQVVHLAVRTDFADVPYYYWAFDQIEACYTAGIVKGYDDGTYKPGDPVTRDQMAAYISRALVIPSGDAAIPDPVPPATFSDVSSTHWAYKQIEYAVSQNVVKGYDDGTYKPDLVVDRGQMAVFIARAIATSTAGADLVNYTPPATATFPDVATTFWAYKYVEYIAQPGIGVTKGYPDGDYHPEYICTRDQMAVYVQRAFQLPM